MKTSSMNSATLLLADGTIFYGEPIGYEGNVVGEVVFNTGMTGYQEVMTDPSYTGQLVTFTYPELGNTGVNDEDSEASLPSVKGIIARQICHEPSNWRCKYSLEEWLVANKIVGIKGIDTRALVRHIRVVGAMNGIISTDRTLLSDLFKCLKDAPDMEGMNLVDKVTTKKPYTWSSTCLVEFDKRLFNPKDVSFRVVAIDFGIKKAILDRLVAHGCEVIVLPANSSFSEVMSFDPEGVFLSNGPGDPAAVKAGINLARHLIHQTDLPLFGICLGHQILGLALGGKTFKLAFGHRGLNHPCGTEGKVEITSQNHGFALDPDSLPKETVVITHLNLNDGTVAAMAMKDRSVFGVQYHPEASPGPHDADHHFRRFVSLIAERH